VECKFSNITIKTYAKTYLIKQLFTNFLIYVKLRLVLDALSSVSKHKKTMSYRMCQKLSSKLLIISSLNIDGFYRFVTDLQILVCSSLSPSSESLRICSHKTAEYACISLCACSGIFIFMYSPQITLLRYLTLPNWCRILHFYYIVPISPLMHCPSLLRVVQRFRPGLEFYFGLIADNNIAML